MWKVYPQKDRIGFENEENSAPFVAKKESLFFLI